MDDSVIKKSRFTELLVQINTQKMPGFKEWVFLPGMLFNAGDKWWGDRGRRSRPHEGLDLCLYRNRQERIVRLEAGTEVPAMYDGVVVKVIDDFLGKSVIIDHNFPGEQRFCSIYGHTIPKQGMGPGDRVRDGEVIAVIADAARSKTGLFPHLHITIGTVSGEASYERMDWDTIGSADMIALVDPISLIGGNYVIENHKCPVKFIDISPDIHA
ncbi:MAG: M23 family metallopeptidase [Nitrospirota bacterium]